MIAPPEGARFFQRENVRRLLHDAEEIFRARIVRADFAKFADSKETTEGAGLNGVTRAGDGSGNRFRLLVARLHHPESDAFGRARTDPGHLPELGDQLQKRDWVLDPLHHRDAYGSAAVEGSVGIFRQSGSSR